MKYNQIFFYTLLSIKIILSEVFRIKKIQVKLNDRSLDYKEEDSFLENAYGNIYNLFYYYATLYSGPNKIPQIYILGIGSDTTTSPCNKCTSCGKHLNKPYELLNDSAIIKCNTKECNSVKSRICRNNQCSFSISYSEGSRLEGIFTMQEIYFEQINKTPNITSKSFKIPIGCTTYETILFKKQLADGILGLNNHNKSFISLLYNNNIISKNLFSICFGQNDGYFSIGEIDTTYHKNKIEYIPFKENRANYYVNLTKIKIGDSVFNISYNYESFIESGTSINYFPKPIFNFITKEFDNFCEKKECGNSSITEYGYCRLFSSNEEKEKSINEYWPNFTFYFEGIKYVLTPKDYYFDYPYHIGACIGFEKVNKNRITLGAIFMHGHDIIFDKENKRIGFTVADCNRGILNNDDINNINVNNRTIIDGKTYIEESYNRVSDYIDEYNSEEKKEERIKKVNQDKIEEKKEDITEEKKEDEIKDIIKDIIKEKNDDKIKDKNEDKREDKNKDVIQSNIENENRNEVKNQTKIEFKQKENKYKNNKISLYIIIILFSALFLFFIFFIILREFICQKKYKNNVQIDEIQNSEINKSDTNIVIK